MSTRAQTVRRAAAGLDFALLGIAEARPVSRPEVLREWVEQGRLGDMQYLAETLGKRLDPDALVPGAKSVICVADRHAREEPPALAQTARQSPMGRIARYAWGDDYHTLLKKRLHRLADLLREVWPDHTFRSAVDTAPVMEREHAQRAGLGWLGKNTLLIHPQQGSYLLLGAIVTTLRIQSNLDANLPVYDDHCGSCTRCLDACPTRCLEPHRIEPTRCVSYLTLEHRGVIDLSLHAGIGDWVAGCDVCQEVCPFNAPSPHQSQNWSEPSHPAYQLRPPGPRVGLRELLDWTPEQRIEVLERSPLKRVKLEMIRRNALIAAGNWLVVHEDGGLQKRVEQIAADASEHELVRETALQVIERIRSARRRT